MAERKKLRSSGCSFKMIECDCKELQNTVITISAAQVGLVTIAKLRFFESQQVSRRIDCHSTDTIVRSGDSPGDPR
jgi:hypothetical protein